MTSYSIKADLDNPLIFRTADKDVYDSAIKNGSIWLRSSDYYRVIEDQARIDNMEGINGAKVAFPLNFNPESAPSLTIQGEGGNIGCEIKPHYIMSLHGTSISSKSLNEFGSYTFGIKNIFKLFMEICCQASKQIEIEGYRYGQVSYQYTSVIMSHIGGSAIACLSGEPSVYVKSIDTDVLRKAPIEPFVTQDEWRIVIFPKEYLNGDPNEPLKINVNPDNFYEYINPSINNPSK